MIHSANQLAGFYTMGILVSNEFIRVSAVPEFHLLFKIFQLVPKVLHFLISNLLS